MKIFVISMLDATERRVNAQTQLDEAGLTFRFYNGIDGAAAWRRFSGYSSLEYRIQVGRPAMPGEVGCFASHRDLWHCCAELKEPIVIMEDDFHARPSFADAIVELSRYIDDYGFVRLDGTGAVDTIPVVGCGSYRLNYCLDYPLGAICYAISPQVAREFIARSKVLRAPVDKFIARFWEHGQPLYSLQPAPVLRSELALEYPKVDRDFEPQTIGLHLRRLARSVVWKWRREQFNARMLKDTSGQHEPSGNRFGSASVTST